MTKEKIIEYLPFLIPIIILELTLTIAAIIHIVRHDRFKFGNKPMWIIISFVQIIGPLVYFIFGRGED